MRINTVVNLFRPDAVQAAKAALDRIRADGVKMGADRDTAPYLGVEALPAAELGVADLMLSFGGDGTLIRASHLCAAHGTPILGIHFGRFGFVTQCQPDEVGAAIAQFMDGDAQIEDRMMVRSDLVREGKSAATLHSLNEVVVQRSATTRALTFGIRVNGMMLSEYPADGVMVATPTGSTGYSLSAGGPIVDPKLSAMMVSAVLPHTLSARPLVLRPDAVVEIIVETMGDAVLSCDGQSRLHLLSGDVVRVTKSDRVTRLVNLDDRDFFRKLATRFQWSRGPLYD